MNNNQEKTSLKFIEQMKNIYNNPDFLSGVHGTSYDEEKVKSILENGIFSSKAELLRIIKTNKGEYATDFNFFCNYVYKPMLPEVVFVISIPIDTPNEEIFKKGIFRGQEGYFLDSKFIVGYYISHYVGKFNDDKTLCLNDNYLNKNLFDNYKNEENSEFHL